MDFELTEGQKMLKQTVHDFAEKEVRPKAAEWEEKGKFVSQEYIKKLADMGLLGLPIDEKYGGQGQGNLEGVLAIEQLARVSTLGCMPVFESALGAVRMIEVLGTEEQKQKFIPPVCRGEKMVAAGMTEPEAGSALTDLKTKAILQDDYYIINGQKRFCTGGGEAGIYVVFARLTEQEGARGIGAIIVEKGSHGFSFGNEERLMGLHGMPHCDLLFDNCQVPQENLLIPAGRFRELMMASNLERFAEGAGALGLAQGAFEEALKYSQERKQFGKDICEFQAIQLMLADMAIKVESARLLLYKAAANAGAGLPSLLEVIMAKCACSEVAREVIASALQIHGGYGYSKEYPLERMWRDAWQYGIGGGTVQMNKVVIAQELLHRRFDQRR